VYAYHQSGSIEPSEEVERIMREFSGRKGEISYEVKLSGNRVKQVSQCQFVFVLTGKGGCYHTHRLYGSSSVYLDPYTSHYSQRLTK
jgi:hypothetical protein